MRNRNIIKDETYKMVDARILTNPLSSREERARKVAVIRDGGYRSTVICIVGILRKIGLPHDSWRTRASILPADPALRKRATRSIHEHAAAGVARQHLMRAVYSE